MYPLKPRLLLPLLLLFLLFTGYACSPSLDTLVKKARAAAKDTPPRRADTTIIILPELLLFKEDAAAHNATSYKVICLDKHGVATNTLADIRCECQLYQQEGDRIKRMRVLWAAEPIGDWTWKRTYFDENGELKMEDKLKVTAPYKFIFVNNKTTWGTGYIHEEYKMYFEMTVIRRPSSRI